MLIINHNTGVYYDLLVEYKSAGFFGSLVEQRSKILMLKQLASWLFDLWLIELGSRILKAERCFCLVFNNMSMDYWSIFGELIDKYSFTSQTKRTRIIC